MKRLVLALLTGAVLAASSPAHAAVKTIVLVHGAFADGSGWKPVADILQSHGYSVLVVQEPETSFAADVAATRRVLDKAGSCALLARAFFELLPPLFVHLIPSGPPPVDIGRRLLD